MTARAGAVIGLGLRIGLGLGLGLGSGMGCASSRDAPPAPAPSASTGARAAAPSVPARAPTDAGAGSLDATAIDAPVPSRIVDAPMRWSERRARLTLEYRRAHSEPSADGLDIVPRAIVLHYTSGNSASGTRGYFDREDIESSRAALRAAGRVNVSAHYVIDRDGTIYQLQPDTRFARHCIGLNHVAIGVENVGDEARWPLTDAQVASNAWLVRELVRRHRIELLIGHHEVTDDHPLFLELDPRYRNQKPDPGDSFMSRVRAAVADLRLRVR